MVFTTQSCTVYRVLTMRSPQRPAVRIDTKRIVADMTERGWNQADLSRRSRVHVSTLSRFLAGEHQTAKTLQRIAKAFGYPTSHYFVVEAGTVEETVAKQAVTS